MSLCSVLFLFLERMGGWGGEVMISEFLRCTHLQFHVLGHHLYLEFFSSSSALVIDITLLAIDSCNKS